jgi:hypothetical protein
MNTISYVKVFSLISIFILINFKAKSQLVFELGIKPTEIGLGNYETNIALGNKKYRFGFYGSFKPSTQDSGLIKPIASGAAGGYGSNHFNKLLSSYTIGFYQKTYFKKNLTYFIETNIYYRNWSFHNKPAIYKNVEGYRFNGLRSENIDVYGLKVVVGKTILPPIQWKKLKSYIDIYIGAGIRSKNEFFHTTNGTVYDTFYPSFKEKNTTVLPSLQLGLKLGVTNINLANKVPK